MDWFLYDKDLRHERVNMAQASLTHFMPLVSFYTHLKQKNVGFQWSQEENSYMKYDDHVIDHNNVFISQMGASFRLISSFSRNSLKEPGAEWV